jgi:hypothetical protein
MEISEEINCEIIIQDTSDPNQSFHWACELQKELIETGLISIIPPDHETVARGSKSVDPVLVAIGFSMLSNSLPQILTFLHDWALRREGRILKIKIQSAKNRFIEMEIPSSMSKMELAEYIKVMQSTMKQKRK